MGDALRNVAPASVFQEKKTERVRNEVERFLERKIAAVKLTAQLIAALEGRSAVVSVQQECIHKRYVSLLTATC